ncbi:hypothetical protein JQ633_20070 [Bradyrhizobium tropiciagri]|uniref:hypothetical protein n=1 Tax=Bradyrhizobium tropiciagri TaxID=312253 RepID=UPI001BA43D1C|nr:hypothetical protein [Bradyrhizobium tropiciagri]MBR0872670.1 hypothetical protein [Bradyrhizobium tropiciagri]
MRTVIFIAAILLPLTGAQAGQNDSPHARECMAKNGFTYEMWRAKRAGTNAQVQSYIACRDGVSLKRAREVGKKNGNFDTW